MAENQWELHANGAQLVQHHMRRNQAESDNEEVEGVGLAEEVAEDNGGVDSSGGSSKASNFDSEVESSVANTSNKLCHATVYKFDLQARRQERQQITAEYEAFRSWLLRTNQKHILDKLSKFCAQEHLEGQ